MTDHRPTTEQALKEITAALDALAATITAALDALAADRGTEGPDDDCLAGMKDATRYAIAVTHRTPDHPLAEELLYRADLLDNGDPDGDTPQALRDLATRVEQLEHDRDAAREALTLEGRRVEKIAHDRAEARAQVERLTTERDEKEVLDTIDAHYNHYAVQKGAESNAESLNPADVKPGEAWLVECRGERRNAVKGRADDLPWSTIDANGRHVYKRNKNVTLITRLVPAPRVITNPDELERLAVGTIIRDTRDGLVCQKKFPGFWDTNMGDDTAARDDSPFGPVTVLWEPDTP